MDIQTVVEAVAGAEVVECSRGSQKTLEGTRAVETSMGLAKAELELVLAVGLILQFKQV